MYPNIHFPNQQNYRINILYYCFLKYFLAGYKYKVNYYYLTNYTNLFGKVENETREYQLIKGNSASPDLDLCKKGCYRGVCRTKKSKSNELCKYDFQCNYCKDRKSNSFYVDLTNYEEVLPDYDVQDELSPKQQSDLNYEISENNEYIEDLNEKIREYNGVR